MLGAAAEAILTMVTCLLYDDALKTGRAPQQHLLKWSFYELLDVAKEAKWLPEELTLAGKLDFRAVKRPVRTDTIRQVRNLVHPARYLKDRGGKEYTVEELRVLYATCHAVYDCLINNICEQYPQFAYFKSVTLRIIWHRILRSIWHNGEPSEQRDSDLASFRDGA